MYRHTDTQKQDPQFAYDSESREQRQTVAMERARRRQMQELEWKEPRTYIEIESRLSHHHGSELDSRENVIMSI